MSAGRNAAYGDCLARLLAFAGNDVVREYYFNDSGAQMEHFGRSLRARARGEQVHEEGYQGEYLIGIAERTGLGPDAAAYDFMRLGSQEMFAEIRATLSRFRVEMDVWTSEAAFHDGGKVNAALQRAREGGHLLERDGATWLATAAFGDDKDRVVLRSDGTPTYFAADMAYLVDKLERGFDKALYVLGADHHGYVARLRAGAAALGFDPERVEVPIYQMVHLTEGGETKRMSKRRGDVVLLDELMDLIGIDAARWYLVSRSHDQTIELDIELAREQSGKNPVYYVQYAHARIAAIERGAGERAEGAVPDPALAPEPTEAALVRALAEFPRVAAEAADLRAPHRIAAYATDLAAGLPRVLPRLPRARRRRPATHAQPARALPCDARGARELARPARARRAGGDVAPDGDEWVADLAVIGGGAGAWTAMRVGRSLGKRVVLFEDHHLGGTCVNVGCIPTKALVRSAEVVETIRNSTRYGVAVSGFRVDFPAVMARMHGIVQTSRSFYERAIAADPGVIWVPKTVRFTDPTCLEWENGSLRVDHIIIGVRHRGLVAADPRHPGGRHRLDGPARARRAPRAPDHRGRRRDRDGVRADLRAPRHEGDARRAGRAHPQQRRSRRRRRDRALAAARRGADHAPDARRARRARATRAGSSSSSSAPTVRSRRCTATRCSSRPGARRRSTASTSRRAGSSSIPTTAGPRVDRELRTTSPHAWAVGDALGRQLYTHVANHEGPYAAKNALQDSHLRPDFYDEVPGAVFCDPELATVGLRSDEAAERGLDAVTGTYPMSRNGKARAMSKEDGFIRMVVERRTRRILGADARLPRRGERAAGDPRRDGRRRHDRSHPQVDPHAPDDRRGRQRMCAGARVAAVGSRLMRRRKRREGGETRAFGGSERLSRSSEG